ncbi:MAG: hypothetical protein KF687_04225 [Cyclobacteriaceae bacterium]|nr:hypothetical protein [Cyclobacteriaceae bacterium]
MDTKEDHDNSLLADDVGALISKALPIIDKVAPKEKGLELQILGGSGL